MALGKRRDNWPKRRCRCMERAGQLRAHAPFAAAARRMFAVDLPRRRTRRRAVDALTAFWLGPRIVAARLRGAPARSSISPPARRDQCSVGGALFDVSAARVACSIVGGGSDAVLARRCPLDFHTSAFPVGHCAQSLLGHIGMLVVKHDEAPSFTLFVARSYARDAWHALLTAAAPIRRRHRRGDTVSLSRKLRATSASDPHWRRHRVMPIRHDRFLCRLFGTESYAQGLGITATGLNNAGRCAV